MANCEHTKLSMFIQICKNDKRMILSRNLKCVCKHWGVSQLQLRANRNKNKCLFLVNIILQNVKMY